MLRITTSRWASALLPAGVLALTAFWSGTFHGGATFIGAISAQTAVLGFAVLASPGWKDPLGLGRVGQWLPVVLMLVTTASLLESPVSRAGRIALILLPAFMLVPAAVANVWRDQRSRRIGAAAITIVTGAVALDGLVRWQLLDSPRAAMPLGHHNLLAGWLVLVTPLAMLPWGWKGTWRWITSGVAVLVLLTMAATGSRMGLAIFLVQTLFAGLIWKRRILWLLPLPVLAALPNWDRFVLILSGLDHSSKMRYTYLLAGWEGFRARPVLGWGPGSTPWLNAHFVRPLPGVSPPGQVVGDFHSLPVQLAFELGAIGLVIVSLLLVAFTIRRWRQRSFSDDPNLLQAGIISLVGGVLFCLANAQIQVLALPVAFAIAMGSTLAAGPQRPSLRGRLGPWIIPGYATVAAVLLVPLWVAHYHYDKALIGEKEGRVFEHLALAVESDPGFPLYRARLAWVLAERDADGATEAPSQALQAAKDASGVAALWLAAGRIASEPKPREAALAFESSCRLDPLNAVPPFLRMTSSPSAPSAAEWGARAILAEPRLSAASFWRNHPDLQHLTLLRTASWPGLEAQYAQALRRTVEQQRGLQKQGAQGHLELRMDDKGATAVSLFAFRRSPWPAVIVSISIDLAMLPQFELEPAPKRRATRPEAFNRSGCDMVANKNYDQDSSN